MKSPTENFEPAEPLDDWPDPVDVVRLGEAGKEAEGRMVVDGLLPERGIITLAAAEGEGKTFMAQQFLRQLLRGEAVFGMFEPGELAPKRALFVDTEQDKAEARDRAAEFDTRGLSVPEGSLFWWSVPEGLELDDPEQQTRFEARIAAGGYDFLWIDSGDNTVSKPKDDEFVRPFFNFLFGLMERQGIKGIGLTRQLRKRVQGEYSRGFDDLFGSREFKGRSTSVFYIDNRKIVCWKDRGGHIRRVWPAREGGRYAKASLLRPGMEDDSAIPFAIEPTEPEPAVDVAALEAKALSLVEETPNHYSKSSLAETLGGRREDALAVVSQMLAEGRLGPNKSRAKLFVPGSDAALAFHST